MRLKIFVRFTKQNKRASKSTSPVFAKKTIRNISRLRMKKGGERNLELGTGVFFDIK